MLDAGRSVLCAPCVCYAWIGVVDRTGPDSARRDWSTHLDCNRLLHFRLDPDPEKTIESRSSIVIPDARQIANCKRQMTNYLYIIDTLQSNFLYFIGVYTF